MMASTARTWRQFTAIAATACARRWCSTSQQRGRRPAQGRDFDWKKIFAAGVRWFHSGGIFAALSPTTAELIVEGMKAAKAAAAVTSFDLNYRAKLWNSSGGHDRAWRCSTKSSGT